MKIADDSTYTDVVLKAQGTVFVDFWAPWCGPCRAIAPAVESLAKHNPTVTVVKVNVDDAQQVAEDLGIRAIPTLIVYKDGKEVKRHVGGTNEMHMQGMIDP